MHPVDRMKGDSENVRSIMFKISPRVTLHTHPLSHVQLKVGAQDELEDHLTVLRQKYQDTIKHASAQHVW